MPASRVLALLKRFRVICGRQARNGLPGGCSAMVKGHASVLRGGGVPPQVGQIELSCEEWFINKLASAATCEARRLQYGATGLLDATLEDDSAKRLLVNQTCALIAQQCIRSTARAAVKSIKANASRGTLFFTSGAKWKLSFDMRVVPLCYLLHVPLRFASQIVCS